MAVMNDLGFPFTSVGGDRQYSSSEWRDYFKALVEGGVVGGVGNELEVKPQTIPNKTIFIDIGSILIEGAMRTIETTVDLSFSDNTSGSARIDRVIARINYNDRKIEFVVKEGTPSASPVAPSLVRDSAVYELSLAQVYLANGYSTITATEITDERQDEAACGYFKYRAKPAWYPDGDIPKEAWMYVAFKEELSQQEIDDIESNPTLMAIIEKSTVGKKSNYNASMVPVETNDTTEGYDVGSVWIATVEKTTTAWICLNSAIGEAVWENIAEFTEPDDPSGSPGSAILIGGDMTEGFFGEVASAELITGDALASEVGISAGISQNSTAGWLKFALDDKILFVAKKPIRHTISWDHINTADCVYGNKTVVIGGLTYKVRLMKGALTDPSLYDTADRGAIGSEWNRLMLPIHVNAPSSWAYPAYVASPTKDWGIDYTDTDLVTASAAGDGSYSWCQEVRNTSASHRVYRGNNGVSNSNSATSSSAYAPYGWRPCLELVS